jgi:broad specificity phosphatase PhoE
MKHFAVCALVMLLTSCSTTIYLTRHAEKELGVGGAMASTDPPLTPDGLQRAKVLADSLTGDRLSGVFATPTLRTQQTAAPTARIMARPVITYGANGGDMLIDSLVRQKQRRFLVVGHSNTVPAMLRHIGLNPSMQTIDDADYDNLVVVKIKWLLGRKMTLTEKTYGKVSP